jgi:transposase
VVGVDAHARTHTHCVIHAPTGAVEATRQFDTTPAANARAITWIKRNTAGDALAAIEGTGSHGARIARDLARAGIEVCDVRPRNAPAAAPKVSPTRSTPKPPPGPP